MTMLQGSKIWKSIGLATIISFVIVGSANAGLFSIFKGKSKSAPRVKVSAPKGKLQSIVIFPLDPVEEIAGLTDETAQDHIRTSLGNDIASAIKVDFSSSRQYTAVLYSQNMAPIKRAKDDSTLKGVDPSGPFNKDDDTSRRLADILSTELYMAGSVDNITFDSIKKIAQVTVSVGIYSTDKGRELKTIVITGKTPEGSAVVNEEDAVALAAGDAVQQIKSILLPSDKEGEKTNTPKKSEKIQKSKTNGKPAVETDNNATPAGTPPASEEKPASSNDATKSAE